MGPVVNPPSTTSSLPLLYTKILANYRVRKPRPKEALLKHLSELMADVAIYGWGPVWAYHTIWLQHVENGRANWGDKAKKL